VPTFIQISVHKSKQCLEQAEDFSSLALVLFFAMYPSGRFAQEVWVWGKVPLEI